MLQLIILSALAALCIAYPADDTKPKPPPRIPVQYIVDLDDAPYDLDLAESAQWGGGRGGWGGGRGGYGGGGGWGGGGGYGLFFLLYLEVK